MNWVLMLGSLAGVLALAFIAWLLGLGGGGIDDAAAAMQHAEDAVGDFAATGAVIAENGHGGLVFGDDGSVVLLKQHGVRIAARRMAPPIAAARVDGSVIVDSGERLFGRVVLPMDDRLLTLL